MLPVKPAVCRGCAVLLWLLPGIVLAETADPLDSAAPTPQLIYQPALHGYPPLPERPMQNWPQANQRVGEIGGWRTYAMEPWEAPKAQSVTPQKQGGASHVHD